MKRETIKNRKGQKIVVIVKEAKRPKGLAFVMHGLGGNKDSFLTQASAEPFKKRGFTVVRFDTINTYGESDGNFEDATTTNYYEDLEDVIAWAKTQDWYQEPFWLSGHSLGGICTALYAQKHPEKVRALAPLSTVVSGKLSFKAHTKEELQEWKKTGMRVWESSTKPGLIKRLKWSHMEDRMKYDLLKDVDKLTMPVLLVVGEYDESCPPEHQRILYKKLPGPKELHIIKGALHAFRAKEHLDELKRILGKWIDSML